MCIRDRSGVARAHAALVYATFATLVAAASVPDVFVVPMGHHTAIQPELRCVLLRDLLAAGQRAAVWALVSTPLALGPLWVEAHRDGRLRWAVGVSAALVVLALGLSALPLVWLTRGALLEGCPGGP